MRIQTLGLPRRVASFVDTSLNDQLASLGNQLQRTLTISVLGGDFAGTNRIQNFGHNTAHGG